MFKQVNPRLLASEPMRRCRLEECRGACCLHGVWLDKLEIKAIYQNAALIAPFMPSGWQEPALWFDDQKETDEHAIGGQAFHTQVLPDPDHYGGSACIFCLGDAKCALQVAAIANGLHAWQFKPYYCILHPLDLDEQGRITLDETKLLLDEAGSCLRPAENPIPLVETFGPELRYLLGEKAYAALCQQNKSK
jgi:hypothetical protein